MILKAYRASLIAEGTEVTHGAIFSLFRLESQP
jgi:hypothetical protein